MGNQLVDGFFITQTDIRIFQSTTIPQNLNCFCHGVFACCSKQFLHSLVPVFRSALPDLCLV